MITGSYSTCNAVSSAVRASIILIMQGLNWYTHINMTNIRYFTAADPVEPQVRQPSYPHPYPGEGAEPDHGRPGEARRRRGGSPHTHLVPPGRERPTPGVHTAAPNCPNQVAETSSRNGP